jgi:hypothetical protein
MRIATLVLVVAAVALAGAVPAQADPPDVRSFQDVFTDIDPCTGLEHTVTIDVVAYEPVFGTTHATHTVTTSSGYVGRGVEIGVFHDAFFTANDMLYNPATGQRIHAHLVIIGERVADVSLTCVPPGL